MEQTHQRRLLAGLVVATLVLLGADLAGSGVAESVRSAGGTVIGPVQRALSGAPRDEIAALEAQNVLLRATVAEQRRRLAEQERLAELLDADATAGHLLVAARVVASDLSPLGGRSLTLDAGARDGITADSTVVTAEGLAGRVVAVSPWTSDVQVLGSTGSVIGVRVGPAGTLATVELALLDRSRVATARLADPVLRAAGHSRRRRRREHPRQRRRPAVCRGRRRRHRDRRRSRPWAADPYRDGAARRRPRRDRGRRRARADLPGRSPSGGACAGKPATPAAPAKAAGS